MRYVDSVTGLSQAGFVRMRPLWTGLACLLVVGAVHAQAPSPPPPNLLQETGWVRLEIIGGRLAVLAHRCGQSRVACSGDAASKHKQQLTLNLAGEALELRYERTAGELQTSLEVDDEGQLLLRSVLRQDDQLFETRLVQPFQGALTLFVEAEKKTAAYSAPNLWRLALDQPDVCRQKLFPLLESLRPHWRLSEQAQGLEQELAALASRDWQTPRQQWAEWVAALDSDDFSERQQALLKFRAAGQPALAWLQRLPQPQLSAEQRLRVSELTRQIAYPEGDVARRTALWLVDDPGAWLALLQREDPAVRATAWEQFSALRRPALAFNPTGAAAERQNQVAQLRQRYGE